MPRSRPTWVVRPVGPLRLRRRRQLQRARRLHRPLPDRPRGRRPGRRRPVPGRGRDLVAPLVRVPGRPATTAPPTTRTAAPRSAPPASGSATTRSSRRTAACRCSRTSTATTSACPTTTTPAGGPDNAVNWWTLMAQSRASATHDVGHRHPRRPTSGRGTSCSSAGSTTRSCSPGQKRTLKLGPHEYNSRNAQGVVVPLPQEGGRRPSSARRRRGRSRGGAARATTSRTRSCRGRHPARRARIADLPGELEHRGLRTRPVRLRARRGERRLRLEVDPRLDHQRRPRATASTARAAAGRPRRSTCRRTPGKTIGLRFRYTTDGAARATTRPARRVSSSTTSPSPPVARPSSATAPRPRRTAGR